MSEPRMLELDGSNGSEGMGTVGVAMENGVLVVAVDLPEFGIVTLGVEAARVMAKALNRAADYVAERKQ